MLLVAAAAFGQAQIIEAHTSGQNHNSYRELTGLWIDSGTKSQVPDLTEGTTARQLDGIPGEMQGSLRFTPEITQPGQYDVLLTWPKEANAAGLQLHLRDEKGTQTTTFDLEPDRADQWVPVGTITAGPGSNAQIRIDVLPDTSQASLSKPLAVVVDALALVPRQAASAGSASGETGRQQGAQDSSGISLAEAFGASGDFDAGGASADLPAGMTEATEPEAERPSEWVDTTPPVKDGLAADREALFKIRRELQPIPRPNRQSRYFASSGRPQDPVTVFMEHQNGSKTATQQSLQASHDPIRWVDAFDKAQLQARQDDVPVLLFFLSPNKRTERFRQGVLADPAVVDLVNQFLPVQLDLATDSRVARRYNVPDAPYVVVLNQFGYTMGHVMMTTDPNEFAQELRKYTKG